MQYRRTLKPIAATTLLLGIGAGIWLGHAAEPRAATAPTAPAGWCAERCDHVISDWSLAAYQVIKAGDGYQDPMAASRSLAMMHLAMHDAVPPGHLFPLHSRNSGPKIPRYNFLWTTDTMRQLPTFSQLPGHLIT